MPPKRTPQDISDDEGKNFDYGNSGSISPFGLMLQRISQHLTNDHCKRIGIIIDLKPAELGKIKDGVDLLQVMQQRNEVSERNVSLLRELLTEIKLEVAVEEIKKYENILLCRDSDHSSDTERPVINEQSQPSKLNTKGERGLITDHKFSVRKSEQIDHTFLSSSHEFKNINQYLNRFGLSNELGKEIGVRFYMTIDEMHLRKSTITPQNIVTAFLTRLMSYDYRATRLFRELLEPEDGRQKSNEEASNDVNSFLTVTSTSQTKLSCRDMIFAILNCCDPFLRQEILSKMAHCQLAVPVLLPYVDQYKVVLLMWGLQRVTKIWRDPDPHVMHEEPVVKYPFPVVSVLRVGNTDLSKSNILNKMLGPVQNTDDHPYFLSFEQDSRQSILSQGTVEGIWYLPGLRDKAKHSLLNAICFLNLRGNAEKFHKQRKYLSQISILTILFISKSSMPFKTHIIKEIVATSRVILVVCGRANISIHSMETAAGEQITLFDASGLSTLDIGEYLCTQVNKILSQPGNRSVHSLENSVPICSESKIDVDIREPVCIRAKQAAQDILISYKRQPKQFKSSALPLQLMWKKWSELDNIKSWKDVREGMEMEIYLESLKGKKNEIRRRQSYIGVSREIIKLYQELSDPHEKYKQFLVFWLQHFLNETFVESLTPLVDTLERLREEIRETAAKITHLKRKLDGGPDISFIERTQLETYVKDNLAIEARLNINLMNVLNEYYACSLGFEHFIREFGQVYECFHSRPHFRDNVDFFDVNCLPRMVAGILLSGHSFEILDGDAYNIPIKWVRGVLSAVSEIIGYCRIYVISVIGMQSSGKSTLLYSMFGVRFVVSAGRCTRGIFLQLLPIDDKLKEELSCDYIAVIDTEGLRGPEKAVTNSKNEDDELATFALYVSDMTLINVGGQAVGEDLSNILQISAHKFFRMKTLNLLPSCYLIQQFVSDVTAIKRNQSSTQSILQILDKAVVTAATEERKQDHYRQFSDCFNIINLDGKLEDVQYIPSLWRAEMSAPNYEYSETVSQLKSALLRDVKQKKEKQTISEFADRIATVWEVVREEDFVFSFCNSNIAQYQ